MNGHPHTPRDRNSAVPAVALITIGAVFLLRNLEVLPIRGNWWALLLLVPLYFLGARILALRSGNGGRLPAAARGPVAGFLSVSLTMLIFLLDLDWGVVWPLFIVLAGISFLAGSSGGGGGAAAPPEDTRLP